MTTNCHTGAVSESLEQPALFDIGTRPARQLSAVSAACKTGTISELWFCAQAGARGWDVFIPFGHAQKADVCIHRPPGRVVGVQIKTANKLARYPHAPPDYHCQCASGASQKVAYKAGDFDVFAMWLPDVEEFVFWRLEELAGRRTLRYSPKRHRAPGNWELLDTAAHI